MLLGLGKVKIATRDERREMDGSVSVEVKVPGLRRKASRNVTFCVKKEKNASYKKILTILQKVETERTPEDLKVLDSCSDVVQQVTLRMEKRRRAKDRAAETEDPPSVLADKCRCLAAAIAAATHLVVYSGAGVSTAACIPDYRGSNGIWTRLQQGKDIGNHDLSRSDPTLTHMALSALYLCGRLKHVVSQNCDGLHLRSGLPRTALSELHGNMYLEVCRSCKPPREYWRLFDVTENTARYAHETSRRCGQCGSALRDTIVHFGERGSLPWPTNWGAACTNAASADVILCIGSSLKVLKRYPWLWGMDKPVKKRPRLYIVNLQWTPKDEHAKLKINGKCDDVMSTVMYHLGIAIPGYERLSDPIFAHATRLHAAEMHTTTQPLLAFETPTDVCAMFNRQSPPDDNNMNAGKLGGQYNVKQEDAHSKDDLCGLLKAFGDSSVLDTAEGKYTNVKQEICVTGEDNSIEVVTAGEPKGETEAKFSDGNTSIPLSDECKRTDTGCTLKVETPHLSGQCPELGNDAQILDGNGFCKYLNSEQFDEKNLANGKIEIEVKGTCKNVDRNSIQIVDNDRVVSELRLVPSNSSHSNCSSVDVSDANGSHSTDNSSPLDGVNVPCDSRQCDDNPAVEKVKPLWRPYSDEMGKRSTGSISVVGMEVSSGSVEGLIEIVEEQKENLSSGGSGCKVSLMIESAGFCVPATEFDQIYRRIGYSLLLNGDGLYEDFVRVQDRGSFDCKLLCDTNGVQLVPLDLSTTMKASCAFCFDYLGSRICLFYPKWETLCPQPACLCCGDEDSQSDVAESPPEPKAVHSVTTNPGWFGKGYRKRLKKKR